jgi:tRNA U34 5-methylaminomethyl-2-thiouridine-forming methyltransferase MnmC
LRLSLSVNKEKFAGSGGTANQNGSVHSSRGYKLVKLATGIHSLHSLAYRETFHPVIGPAAEAETLYVRQGRLRERLQASRSQFVIWDIGLGAAANALTVLRATREIPCAVHVISFDQTLEPLEFALEHTEKLDYLLSYEQPLRSLIQRTYVHFQDGARIVTWHLHLGDFPTLLAKPSAQKLPKPHAIMFDAFSPAANPAMWTAPLFTRLFELLDPERPCALPTYSRSTMLRVTLLLAGFFVGVGHATGEKEETTIAANTPDLVAEPLDRRWLQRARRSTSAEPLWKPLYRQARLSATTWERLQEHPQFR